MMKKYMTHFGLMFTAALVFFACNEAPEPVEETAAETEFEWMTEQFADVKIIRYQIPAWDELSLANKKLAYFLSQAGLSARDIIYDQNYKHNLHIKRTLEKAYDGFEGDKTTADWKAFETYLKRIWFSNGIHHHYSYDKFVPGFSQEYLQSVLDATGLSLSEEVMTVIFDPSVDAKKVSKEAGEDLVAASAVNFYGDGITQAEVEAFYKDKAAKAEDLARPLSYGLNSKLVRDADGNITERVYKVGDMYSDALEQTVFWLQKAVEVAENTQQREALELLIAFYVSGDLKTWDAYNVAWVNDTTGVVDYIQGFIEVYNDPLGYTGSFESIVQIRDLDASKKMKVIAENAQYFEDNSTILPEHKKENVVGITYNFINVASEAGDASPTTPIGVNLPNANWIRAEYGSKSVSLGNIVAAYDKAGAAGMLEEFSYDSVEVQLAEKHGDQAAKLHTALHEVIGHASGKINEGVGTPKQTLKNYASTIEEARADLVALYYIFDPKLIEIGVMDHMDVAKHQYNSYIKNALMLQMRRLEPGAKIEQDHMRNRQLVAAWAFEKGSADNVISKEIKDGKTYFVVNDYEALRALFGELLRDIQRITSEGDFEAAQALVETYGVVIDADIHAEVLERSAQFKSAPYGGFINPRLVAVEEGGNITDIKVEYPDDFASQMLEYAGKYTFLPDYN
jgi:dipeptidyl-peptidase-3